MKKLALGLIVLAAGSLVWFGLAPRKGRLAEVTPKGAKEATVAARASAAKRRQVSNPGGTAMAGAGRLLTREEFKRRFQLNDIEEMD